MGRRDAEQIRKVQLLWAELVIGRACTAAEFANSRALTSLVTGTQAKKRAPSRVSSRALLGREFGVGYLGASEGIIVPAGLADFLWGF